ncbi:hypothetical protein DE4585_01212 [Mycobacteroides salmoniphilum]|uniref:Lipoprotein n=1 Tax=Mycobacteroides salmoniphilum TaxID=404941 RepID=A0A4R8S7X1_9MYCO|nr:hypothetical protein DE4586_02728 [Mycobacteroides salmoniphilum]TDZ85889.1 hypothetical protein DE4585_01212 [Mycobacteroides salmoniphilum]TDZ86645.1 hypothetical protein DE4587_02032 [Mycobacteroides salmoniphilum]TDZ90084.1 hypothetical protein CCUG60885_04730 [Mycobacteroides salmoniphilum]TEA00050.1 hypothetical protein CCUG60883_04733 [Mycobacteroides salmoniphilum]
MSRLTLASLLAILLVSGCTFGMKREGDSVTGPTANDQGFSLLTDAGIAEINRTKSGRFDLRSGRLSKSAVGLEGLDRGAMIGHPGGSQYTFAFLGPISDERITTQNITFASHDTHDFFTIVWFSAPESLEAAHAELRAGVEHWGWHPRLVQQWFDSVNWPPSSNTEAFRSVISMGVSKSGLVVDVQGTRKDGKEVLQYGIYLGDKYYTSETQQKIRDTGRS